MNKPSAVDRICVLGPTLKLARHRRSDVTVSGPSRPWSLDAAPKRALGGNRVGSGAPVSALDAKPVQDCAFARRLDRQNCFVVPASAKAVRDCGLLRLNGAHYGKRFGHLITYLMTARSSFQKFTRRLRAGRAKTRAKYSLPIWVPDPFLAL